MKTKIFLLILYFLLIFFGRTNVWGEPPESAYIEGITTDCYPGGICYLASLGQLLQLYDPNIQPVDVLVRSGMCSQAYWAKGPTDYTLSIHPRMYNSREKLYSGPTVDAAQLCGAGYIVGYGQGGGGGEGWVKNADKVLVFESQDEAVDTLKGLIADGIAVQVHIDPYYVKDELSIYNPFWAGATEPGSHFVVVHGYDQQYVYYTDNCPTDVTGGSDGVGLPLSWSGFLTAWRATEDLPADQHTRTGPYFLSYLDSGPNPIDDDWILAFLVEDAWDGPVMIRAAAEKLRRGADGETTIGQFTRDRFAEIRPYMADYLEELGYSEAAGYYDESAGLWWTIKDNPNWGEAADILEAIADAEEQALESLAEVIDTEEPFRLIRPNDGQNLGELEAVFQWRALPEVTDKLVLQLAMRENFDDRRSVLSIKATAGVSVLSPATKDWIKALAKDNGNEQLMWRLSGLGKYADQQSPPRMLSWNQPQIAALAPADGYACSEDELVNFSFTAPAVCQKPQVVISTTGDFGDRKSLVKLKVIKGTSAAAFQKNTLAQLRKKDDGDNIVYWQVLDGAATKTTVEASEVRELYLP